MMFDQIVREIAHLSVDERKALITLLVDSLTVTAPVGARHDLLDYEGVGAHLRDQDAQDYVNGLRSEWDQRP